METWVRCGREHCLALTWVPLNPRTRVWVVEAHSLNGYSKTALEIAPPPGKTVMLGKPDFDERQNQGALGLGSHMALGSQGTQN